MKNDECIDSATGQETQLAVLGTTERALYTVQSIRNVLHYDALQKEPESYGSVKKLREADGIYRPELDGTKWKRVEYAGSYSILQCLGSVNPYSYPCRRVRASDLWCRRWRDVSCVRIRGLSLLLLKRRGGWCLIELELVLELESPVSESVLKAEGLSERCSGPLVVLGVGLAAPGLKT